MKDKKKHDAQDHRAPGQTAPNPATVAKQNQAEEAKTIGKERVQSLPYAGRLVRYVSRDQFVAAAHSGEADFAPAIIARVLPTKGPDDNPFRVDLIVFDAEREGGAYVQRTVAPFDGTGPGYDVLEGPVAVSIDRNALKDLVALCMEDYLAQRDKDDSRYDEASIRELVADEVHKVLSAQGRGQASEKGGK